MQTNKSLEGVFGSRRTSGVRRVLVDFIWDWQDGKVDAGQVLVIRDDPGPYTVVTQPSVQTAKDKGSFSL